MDYLEQPACATQLQEYRYQVAFDAALESVRYTFHYFQTWDPETSCAGCSLADTHVGLNRRLCQ